VAVLGVVSVKNNIMGSLTAEKVEQKEDRKEGKRKRERERKGDKEKRRRRLIWLHFCAKRAAARRRRRRNFLKGLFIYLRIFKK
jgi:hypothetical protein